MLHGAPPTPWSALIATLPAETGAQLVNGLAVGLGFLAVAARRAARDEPVAAVERALAAAHDALARALQLLPELARPADGARLVPDAPVLPPQVWRTFLLTRDTSDDLQDRLVAAVRDARAAGSAFVADGEAETVIAGALAVRDALAELHERLSRRRPPSASGPVL